MGGCIEIYNRNYIEIYNGYKNSINLSNYHLSDDEYDTKKWTFPDITIKSNVKPLFAEMNSSFLSISCHTIFL